MKKLLILLFSLLISFNSYAGSLDGKGLKCEPREEYDDRPMFIWFENGMYNVPEIWGYEIIWFAPYSYTLVGTKGIEFRRSPSNATKDLLWWKYKTVNRETLKIREFTEAKGSCQIIYSKQVIIDGLNEEINVAKSTNKI